MPTAKLATHSLLGTNTEKLDLFTSRFFTTLLGKAGFYVTESRTSTTRTFALHKTPPAFVYTPDSDESRAREDSKGESFETEPHELGPVTRLLIHEADEATDSLARIREADRFATED